MGCPAWAFAGHCHLFYEFQWLFERAGHGGGQVGVGGGFTAKGVAVVPGMVFYGGEGGGGL